MRERAEHLLHERRDHQTRGLLWACALLVALLAGGCGSSEPEPSAQAEPLCRADAECDGAESCRAGFCVATEEPTRQLEFTFLPGARSGHLAQRFMSSAVDPTQPLQFVLEPSLRVSGQVAFTSSLRTVSGTLIFQPEGASERTFTRQATLDQGGAYEVFVTPGVYTITFVPGNAPAQINTSRPTPGRVWKAQRLEADTELNLRLPDPEQIRPVEMLLSSRQDSPGLGAGLAGVRVVAISRETGVASTSDVTDEDGQFVLYLWRDTGVYDLVLSPSTEAAGPSPNTTLPSWLDSSEPTLSQNIELDADAVLSREVTITLDDEALASDVVQPSEVQLIIRTQTDTGELSMTRALDASGQLVAQLAPRLYEVEIVPPPASRYARTTVMLDATDLLTRTLTITPDARRAVTLQARDHRGEPVGNARVELVANAQAGDPLASAYGVPWKTTTDAAGEATVWLEPRRYTARLTPPAESGLPRTTVTIEPVDEAKTSLLVTLARPGLVEGTVWSNEAGAFKAQDGVVLQVHEVRQGQRVLLGEGQTDARGDFALIIPSEAP